jgi:predicted nucleic acid-binding protein
VADAVLDYLDLPLTRHGHLALLPRVLELYENLSAYDATYVALAERLACPLLTADDRLIRAATTHTRLTYLP